MAVTVGLECVEQLESAQVARGMLGCELRQAGVGRPLELLADADPLFSQASSAAGSPLA